MKRMSRVMLALVLPALLLAARQPATAANLSYTFDFQHTLAPFVAGADNPKYLTKYTLSREVEQGLRDAAIGAPGPRGLGNAYAALTNDQGAAVVYMAAQLKGSGVALRVQVLARDLAGCGRCALVVYTGKAMPGGIAGFAKVGAPLTKEWDYYAYTVPLDLANPVVAIGIFSLDQTQTLQRAALDNLTISFLDD